MSPIEIPLEELAKDANWKPGGQSPAMNPQAVIQFTEQLLTLVSNPQILLASGVQIYELIAELIRSGPLKNNARKIQVSRDEIALRMGGGPPVASGVVGPTPGASAQVVPGAPTGGEGIPAPGPLPGGLAGDL